MTESVVFDIDGVIDPTGHMVAGREADVSTSSGVGAAEPIAFAARRVLTLCEDMRREHTVDTVCRPTRTEASCA